MTLQAVQEVVKTWSEEEQDELAAFLAVLRQERSEDHATELERRVADHSKGAWLNLGDVKRRLAESSD